jgi:hypothetical protein
MRMGQRKGRRPTVRPPDFWACAFEQEVRRSSTGVQIALLFWLRDWRRRPRRVFWIMKPLGGWRRI